MLTYHVLAGKVDGNGQMGWIKKNGGTYTAKTEAGGELTFMLHGKHNVVADETGNTAKITIKDVYQ